MRIGRGSPSSNGNSGAPSQSKGGATIISSTCWTMWTCSSSDVNGSIGEARARKSADSAGHERDRLAPRPAPLDPADARRSQPRR